MEALDSHKCNLFTKGEIVRMRITLQIEVLIRGISTFCSAHARADQQSHAISAAKIAVDKEWESLRQKPGWKTSKVRVGEKT